MSNPSNKSSRLDSESVPQPSSGVEPDVSNELQPQSSANPYQTIVIPLSRESAGLSMFSDEPAVRPSAVELQRRLERINAAQFYAYRRKHLRTSIILFVLTFLSAFLVGSGYFPLEYVLGKIFPRIGFALQQQFGDLTLDKLFADECRRGFEYAIPLMAILFCHEMGHYLQSVKNRVPASLPYFIPMPISPMGTMGAVIFQGRGVATRRQMFDIAVWGPLAGLAVTLPVLWYGLRNSGYVPVTQVSSLEYGEPLVIKWMIYAMHGAAKTGETFALNSVAFAGWVGVLITAMNLLPVGQLDGGHILYTLIGRRAHIVAYIVIGIGFLAMVNFQEYSFSLLLLLLMMTGVRHPPTSNDHEPLGLWRHIVGWLTLSFLIIGFTPTPISTPNSGVGQTSQSDQE